MQFTSRMLASAAVVTAAAATAATIPMAAYAQAAYPNHTIKMVAPYEPGGGVDIMARMVAQKLSLEIGQTVVVDNRPGAGGAVGTQSVVNSLPDGYTIEMASTSPIVVAPFLQPNLGYKPDRDLAPVSLIASVPALLVVKPDAPFKTVAELIAQSKASPGKYTYSSSGIGGTAHLAAQLLKMQTGIELLHVPYKGTGPATTAVMSGEVTMSFTDVVAGLPYVQSGRLKAIAITGSKRSDVLPDVPTIAETVPGYAAGVWYAVFAPAKTPPAIIDTLNKALVRATRKDIAASLAAQGVQAIGSSPAELTAFIKEENERWGKVIKESGMKPE